MRASDGSNPRVARSNLLTLEDWWAVWLGSAMLAATALGLIGTVPEILGWTTSPLETLGASLLLQTALLGFALALLNAVAIQVMNGDGARFLIGFLPIFAIAVLAFVIGEQRAIDAKGLGYALWALLLGLLVSNTLGTPAWIRRAVRSELFIKTGLVLLGAEVLFRSILSLGLPGLFVAWFVTPIVIIVMFWYGTKVLAMKSKALVIVIAAATSVCGVSAAIAAAAAARAKKDELTLAVGMTLIFTVVMMVGMPLLVKLVGMDPIVGAAWIGGTVDSTGAVVAAGSMLGEDAEQVAAVVKMIQNVLIGVVAFFIALYWVTCVESSDRRPDAMDIWRRFPKFILGFVGASLVFSFVLVPILGADAVDAILGRTEALRNWFFCLAFSSIGLESNFVDLGRQMSGGQPIKLYVIGQSFNLALTLLAAYLAFGGILFDSPF